jgi:hypothetical protein
VPFERRGSGSSEPSSLLRGATIDGLSRHDYQGRGCPASCMSDVSADFGLCCAVAPARTCHEAALLPRPSGACSEGFQRKGEQASASAPSGDALKERHRVQVGRCSLRVPAGNSPPAKRITRPGSVASGERPGGFACRMRMSVPCPSLSTSPGYPKPKARSELGPRKAGQDRLLPRGACSC